MMTIQALDELEATPHATVFPDGEPRTIRLELQAGESIASHNHPDRDIIFYLIEGTIELTLDDETYEVAGGDIVRFDGEHEVSPKAVEDSVALIVLARRTAE